jgi:hypothetical protein
MTTDQEIEKMLPLLEESDKKIIEKMCEWILVGKKVKVDVIDAMPEPKY